MLLVEAPFAFRAAVLAMTVATLGVVQEFVRARQLADEGETVRLPKGASAPRLLFSRN